MNQEELEAIKTRYEATSIAPWVSFIEGRDCESGSSFIMTGIEKGENIWGETRGEDLYLSGGTNADLDFIAHARQDIPRLLEEIERLKTQLEEKNMIGTPINADDVFEQSLETISANVGFKIPYKIREDWEVLFAQADVTNLNATVIFNWGRLFESMSFSNEK